MSGPPSEPLLRRVEIRPRPDAERIVFQGSHLDKALALEISRQCRSGYLAWNRLVDLLVNMPTEGPPTFDAQTDIFSEIQIVIVSAGVVSSILWPKPFFLRTPEQKEASIARGRRLRDALKVPDTSLLNNRVLRNSIEHIDERLEDHYAAFGPGPLRDYNLALRAPPTFVFPDYSARGFIIPRAEVWFFGGHGDLQAISQELWNLGDSFGVLVRKGKTNSMEPPGRS
jgi:hypothetical protein